MPSAEMIIRKAILSEKGNWLKETGGNPNAAEGETFSSKIVLHVDLGANKVSIRAAVEKLWNVKVYNVRTSIVRGKEKRVGRFIGRGQSWKKAVVTLAPGQTVDFMEGV